MILYIYAKCSTCQKAVRFLEKNKSVTTKEITVTPPSIVELKLMLKLQNGQLKKLFNTSGNMYKEMHLSQKLDLISEDEALELLSKNGMLVKRPFLLGDGFGLVGFNEDRWAEVIK
jgi:arsenate reductase